MKVVIGIDPGVTGAVAIFRHASLSTVFDIPSMRDTNKSKRKVDVERLHDLFDEHLWPIEEAFRVYLELSHAMPGQGVSSMFSYGRTSGLIEGLLAGLGFTNTESPIKKVPPAVWKRRLNLLSNAHAKEAAMKKAKVLYPHAPLTLAKHHNRAEAILIGHYGCQMEGLVK